MNNMEEVTKMLLEFKCANHKSIKEKIKFSMIAGSDHTAEEYLKNIGGIRVLRSAIIYGPNGSGKSNFINSLSFMRDMVCNSINHQPGQGVFQARHKLASVDTPSEYDIQFIKNDIRYAYGFSIVKNQIDSEYLYYFPNGRQTKIFERKNLDIIPGDKYKKNFELSKTALKNNRLFLSCAANFSNINEVEEAFKFFMEDIVVYNPNMNNWTEYSIDLMQSNVGIKKIFIEILKSLGTGIKDVNVKLEKVNISELQNEIQLPEQIKMLFGNQEANKIEAKVIYDEFDVDLMTEESTGIKKLFEIICPMIDILYNGKILICDEIETSLHESVVYSIVKIFQNFHKEQFAQLIFTTHDTSLLDSKLFRRDQIWFTQLKENRSTDLYSLVEIKNVRKSENLEKGYILGKYGAMPMLNDKVKEFLEHN